MSKVSWRVILLLAICLLAGQLLIGAKPASAAPPANDPAYHLVRRGETLAYIGRLYGVNYWAIAQANGIVNPNCIYAGQMLVIPSGGYRPYQPYPSCYGGGSYPSYGGGYYLSYGGGSYPSYGGGSYPSYGGGSYPFYGGGSYWGGSYPCYWQKPCWQPCYQPRYQPCGGWQSYCYWDP